MNKKDLKIVEMFTPSNDFVGCMLLENDKQIFEDISTLEVIKYCLENFGYVPDMEKSTIE